MFHGSVCLSDSLQQTNSKSVLRNKNYPFDNTDKGLIQEGCLGTSCGGWVNRTFDLPE